MATLRSVTGRGDRARPGARGFDEVYRERYRPLLRTAILMIGNRAVAEELVQEAFLQLHRDWDQVDRPPAFVHTALVRRCYDHHRRLAVAERHRPLHDGYVLDPDLDDMWGHLEGLSPEHRVVLVLRYYEDRTVDEISRIMDCPAGTTKSRISRALEQLRQEVDR